MVKSFGKLSVLAVAASGLLTPSSVSAAEMALTLKEQQITLVGQFGGFEGSSYILITDTGTFFVPPELATCEGPDCLQVIAEANS